ncbi:PAS domain-containing protein [Natronorubrum sp. JWXQ-INN-674]|uniref:PAS domain-containing protein n=1 Tax=Natronorubrum halalkaliphilum TaxID=2691917 RepID=A0A6B0VR06_9EURY|nr:histidine kinase N-terminal 7TM domain-containing protein [Natronorubrum halalkaliphilum]MXV63938.1 PAS domain-containing protein [Natronorubrum halalkaliphilum]
MTTTSATTALQYGAGLGAVVLSGYFAAAMLERRGKPTVRPLLLLAVVVAVGSVVSLATSYPPVERALTPAVWPDGAGSFWVVLLTVLVIVTSGLWFLFALRYSGRGGPLIRPAAATVGVFWALIFGLAVFGDVSPPPEAGQTHVEFALGLGAFFMTILLAIGVLLVLTTSLQQNAIGFREGLALSGGAVALAFGPIIANSTYHPASVPITLLAASGLFSLAVRRYPVFEAPPIVRIAGRDRLIEEMDDAVIVTDLEDRIRDLNPAAEGHFDTDRSEALGEPVESLLPGGPEPSDLERTEEPVELRTAAETTLAVTANRITDARDRTFGHLLVCRNVTERRRRERRLGVLNQLLTGAVIDRMSDVAESAAPIASSGRDGGSDSRTADDPAPSSVGAEIRAQTSELVRLVTRTREIERALADESAAEADALSAIRNVADAVSEDAGMDIDFEVEAADAVPPAAIDAAVLETILETLLADAIDRERKRVSLEITDAGRQLEIHVVEAGPTPSESPGMTNVDADRTAKGDEEDRERWLRELSIEMARLAATHVGGDVSTRSDRDVRRVVLEVPTTEERSATGTEPVLVDESADDGPTGERRESR